MRSKTETDGVIMSIAIRHIQGYVTQLPWLTVRGDQLSEMGRARNVLASPTTKSIWKPDWFVNS
jgi:hypothetical protein